MSRQNHWETVYIRKAETEVSWYQPHAQTSKRLIMEAAVSKDAPIIDVGAGASTLADDLIAEGYRHLTLLDISEQALNAVRTRLTDKGNRVRTIVADVLQTTLDDNRYRVWHDRAVFHFLVTEKEKQQYLALLKKCLEKDGYFIIATFADTGPDHCSGLPVVRYSESELEHTIGPSFTLLKTLRETHRTPSESEQDFIYGVFKYCR